LFDQSRIDSRRDMGFEAMDRWPALMLDSAGVLVIFAGRGNDGGIDDRAGLDPHRLSLQLRCHRFNDYPNEKLVIGNIIFLSDISGDGPTIPSLRDINAAMLDPLCVQERYGCSMILIGRCEAANHLSIVSEKSLG
jgi:hypothetical protein